MDNAKAKQKYRAHKRNAAQRGIDFELSFEQWLEVWGDKLDSRGRHADEYGMCRFMDRGAYKVGNVFIGTPAKNGRTRRLVTIERAYGRMRSETPSEPPKDSDWNEDNPWLPDEFKPRTSWSWGHKEY